MYISGLLFPVHSSFTVAFRQILAITKVNGAELIYTDDANLAKRAKRTNVETVGIAKPPLPPAAPQQALDFENATSEEAN